MNICLTTSNKQWWTFDDVCKTLLPFVPTLQNCFLFCEDGATDLANFWNSRRMIMRCSTKAESAALVKKINGVSTAESTPLGKILKSRSSEDWRSTSVIGPLVQCTPGLRATAPRWAGTAGSTSCRRNLGTCTTSASWLQQYYFDFLFYRARAVFNWRVGLNLRVPLYLF